MKLEQLPTLPIIDEMISYTDARIEAEPNPLGVILLQHHRAVYCKMADVILNNVLEEK